MGRAWRSGTLVHELETRSAPTPPYIAESISESRPTHIQIVYKYLGITDILNDIAGELRRACGAAAAAAGLAAAGLAVGLRRGADFCAGCPHALQSIICFKSLPCKCSRQR